jgi:polysaccharide biosynthesis transport protein
MAMADHQEAAEPLRVSAPGSPVPSVDLGLFGAAVAAGSPRASLPARARERLRAARHRLVPMLIVGGSVLCAAVAAALLWPPTYRSTGTILIEQQEIPDEYVHSAITTLADERVQTISQRVMTSGNLLEIIRKYNLYSEGTQNKSREAIVAEMRNDIKLAMISAEVMDPRQGRATRATLAFSVSYSAKSPKVAAAVANELTSLYLRQNLETRNEQAAGAVKFLSEEAERIGTQVTQLEQQLTDFKEKHEKNLPEDAQLNIQLTSRASDDLRDLDSRIRALDQQILFLDGQLGQISPTSTLYGDTGQRVLGAKDQLKLLQTQYAAALASYSPTHPDVVRLKHQIEGLEKSLGNQTNRRDLERMLEQAKADLAASRETHSEEHPDVVRLSRQVTQLEKELASQPQTPATPLQNDQPDNPAYIQIQASRQAADSERASLIAQRTQLRAHLADLERLGAEEPAVARDYDALMADLTNAQKKHAEIQQKQMDAQLAANLETERKGEHFTLIEPPLEPERPASPNRPLIIAMGVLAAFAAAIGLMLILEALDTRIRGRDDLMAVTGVPPLAVVPWVRLVER